MIEKQVPLHELLASVPEDHRLVIHGEGNFPSSTSIPVGRLCHEASKELEKQFELRFAVRRLLDDVNARYPDKNPREWSCPHMQALDDMTRGKT